MLLEYPNHRRWIWFTGALFFFALGAYVGLGGFPAAQPSLAPVGWPLVRAAVVLGALRLVGLRRGWFEGRPRLRRLAGVLTPATGGLGLLALGVHYGSRWAVPGGPAAGTVA